MKFSKQLAVMALFALLLPAGLFAQEKTTDNEKTQTKEKENVGVPSKEADHGMVECVVRDVTGDVYGRPDLQTRQCLGCGTPFNPGLRTSKFNEYRDVRDGFYVRRFNLHYDDILGSKYYVSLKSQKAIYHDQSYLATFGQYGKFRLQ